MNELLTRVYGFEKHVFPTHSKLYERLASEGQSPKTLMISCADSRIVPEHVMQAQPGDLRHRIRGLRGVALALPAAAGHYRANGTAIKDIANYFNVMLVSSSFWQNGVTVLLSESQILAAMSDDTRRDLLEQIIIRPRRLQDLVSEESGVRSNVSYHVQQLVEAGLVARDDGKLYPCPIALAFMRIYFDRLWLEAELGDSWLARRERENSDYGL